MDPLFNFTKTTMHYDYEVVKVDSSADSSVTSHSRSRTKDIYEKIYECGECHKVLSSSASLKRHMLMHDPFYVKPEKVLKYSCETCGKSFATPSYLERHMTVHTHEKKYKCHNCNKRFTQNEHFQRHLLSAHTPGAKVYKCTFPGCKCEFVGASILRHHMKRHAEWGTWTCEHCSKVFLYRSQLKRHVLEHTDPKLTHKCDVCGALFTSAGVLTRHKKIHTREYESTCQVCHAKFQSTSGFREHVLKKCGRDAYKYKCDQCDRCFFKEARLVTHKRSHAPGAKVGRVQKRHKYTCRVCTKTLPGSREFRLHSEEETCGRKAYPFMCDKCPRNFFKEGTLKLHMNVHGKGRTIFQCGTCQNTYSLRRTLRMHLCSTGHEAEDVQFKCKACRKNFPSFVTLETHSATCTAKVKESLPRPPAPQAPAPRPVEPDPQFTCKKCLRMFVSKEDLLSHIAAEHSYAFVCHICGERFKKKHDVKSHAKKEHKE